MAPWCGRYNSSVAAAWDRYSYSIAQGVGDPGCRPFLRRSARSNPARTGLARSARPSPSAANWCAPDGRHAGAAHTIPQHHAKTVSHHSYGPIQALCSTHCHVSALSLGNNRASPAPSLTLLSGPFFSQFFSHLSSTSGTNRRQQSGWLAQHQIIQIIEHLHEILVEFGALVGLHRLHGGNFGQRARQAAADA